MSHDEPTLPERRQAEVLARWLDGATDHIPEDLDEDVIEAVIALRPELAPELSLTAEDILAGVTSGPLAAPSATSIADDAVAAPLPAPANSRRWVSWAVAGVGGLTAVAAAALLFVSTATLTSPDMGSVAQMDEARDNGAVQAEPPAPADAPAPTPAAAESDASTASNRQQERTEGSDEIRIIMGAPAESGSRAREASGSVAKSELDNVAGGGGDGVVGGLMSGDAELGVGRGGGGGSAYGAGAGAIATRSDSAGEPAFDMGDAVADLDDDFAGPADEEVQVRVERELNRAPVAAPAAEVAEVESLEDLAATESTTATSSRRAGRAVRDKAEGKSVSPTKDAEASIDLAALERAARPTSQVAAEVEALQGLMARGQAGDARASAQRLLDGGGLSDLRRADLYWVLGEANRKLGADQAAESAYREAIRLRGR